MTVYSPTDPQESIPTKHDALPHDQRRARRPNVSKRLTRTTQTRLLGGVLGGIAAFVGANPQVVRVLFGISVLLSAGVTAVGYVLLWLLLPSDA